MIQLHSQITHLVAEIGLRDDPDLQPATPPHFRIRTRWGVMFTELLISV